MKKIILFTVILFCGVVAAYAQTGGNARIIGIGDGTGYTAKIITFHDSSGGFVMPNTGIPITQDAMFLNYDDLFKKARAIDHDGKLFDYWVSFTVRIDHDGIERYTITNIIPGLHKVNPPAQK